MAKQALKIIRGSTFSKTFRYESPEKIYRMISSVTNSAPVTITTTTAHNLPSNWRVKVTNVGGMTEINSTEDYKEAKTTSSTAIEINLINAVGFKTYTSGGVLEYNQPVNLTGYTSRMQVRETVDSTTALLTLDTSVGIVIDVANSTITIGMSATDTETITWDKGVYSLELVSPTGIVTTLLEGNISSSKEVTRYVPAP